MNNNSINENYTLYKKFENTHVNFHRILDVNKRKNTYILYD